MTPFWENLRSQGMKDTCQYKDVSHTRDTCPACGSENWSPKTKLCSDCNAFVGICDPITLD